MYIVYGGEKGYCRFTVKGKSAMHYIIVHWLKIKNGEHRIMDFGKSERRDLFIIIVCSVGL